MIPWRRFASAFTLARVSGEASRRGRLADNDPKSEAIMACSVNTDGKDSRIRLQKAEYWRAYSFLSLERITGRVAWKKEGWESDVGGVDGKTPRLTSLVRRYMSEDKLPEK